MSNNDLINMNAFNNAVPAGAFAALNPGTESLADGIGASYGILSYKGKNFSMRHRGQKYLFTRADDGTSMQYLDVIILRAAGYKSKSYYAGTYQEGQDGHRPTCSALDGVTPDADVTNPQAPACAICPRNVFGMNEDGRKSKDCGDYKRLAVLIIPSLTQRIMGAALMEPVFLRVPAASLNDLATLGTTMAQKGFHYSTFVTRVGFVQGLAYPKMTFRAIQQLTDAEAPMVMPMREDPQSYRITGESEVGKPRPAIAAPVSNVVPLNAQPRPAPVVAGPKPAPEPESVDTGFGGIVQHAGPKPGANVVIDVAATVVSSPATAPAEVVDTSFGQQTQPAVIAAVNTVEDTGAPEEADLDLDARVAAMLQR